MSVQANKAIVHLFTDEVWNQGNIDAFEGICAVDFRYHDPAAPGVIGLRDYRRFVSVLRSISPDMRFSLDDVIACGDSIVACYTLRGRHRSSGEQITRTGIAIFQVFRGRIVELRDSWGALGAPLLKSLVTPPKTSEGRLT